MITWEKEELIKNMGKLLYSTKEEKEIMDYIKLNLIGINIEKINLKISDLDNNMGIENLKGLLIIYKFDGNEYNISDLFIENLKDEIYLFYRGIGKDFIKKYYMNAEISMREPNNEKLNGIVISKDIKGFENNVFGKLKFVTNL